MRYRLPLLSLVFFLSSGARAQAPVVLRRTGVDTWTNRASLFPGVRGGLAVPPGLAPNIALDLGVVVPSGFVIRAMWRNNPPGLPFILGHGDSKITKEAERLRIAEETAPSPSPRATP